MWFFIALIAPFLWSIVNHADKIFLSKYSKEFSIGSLMIFSTLSGVVIVIGILFFGVPILNIPLPQILILISAGILSAVAIMLYIYALSEDEATIVVPFMQLVPVFSYLFGYVILKETLTANQIIGSSIILLGATILSIEINEEGRWHLRRRVVALMLAASMTIALYQTLYKYVADSIGFSVSTFWEYIGVFIFGLTLTIFFNDYRTDFIKLIKGSIKHWKIGLFNIVCEILTLTGNLVMNYALLLAPVSLVLIVTGYQPVFVFIFGVILTLFFPTISTEKLTLRHLFHKFLAITVIVVGTYIVFTS